MNGQLCAYLLTHPWPSAHAPRVEHITCPRSLRSPSQPVCTRFSAGRPGARQLASPHRLIHTVLQRARHARFTDVRLVAVQQSQAFWQRYGFQVLRTHAELTTTL
jgi:hypothetical protein